MQISLLQLNIESGRFLEKIISHITSNNYDIIQFQEVSGGTFNSYHQHDIFEQIKNQFGFEGVLTKTMTGVDDPTSYFGNATFFKPSFSLQSQHVVWLYPFTEMKKIPNEVEEIKNVSRNAIHVILEKDGETINLVNTHMAWGPNPKDEQYKLDQGEILVEYMKGLHSPFLLSGDFNVTPDSQIVQWLETFSRDLTTEHHITNTLNAHVHKAAHLFPPGLAVDYIFISKDIEVKKFEVVKETLSDHLGLKVSIKY